MAKEAKPTTFLLHNLFYLLPFSRNYVLVTLDCSITPCPGLSLQKCITSYLSELDSIYHSLSHHLPPTTYPVDQYPVETLNNLLHFSLPILVSFANFQIMQTCILIQICVINNEDLAHILAALCWSHASNLKNNPPLSPSASYYQASFVSSWLDHPGSHMFEPSGSSYHVGPC